MPNVIFTGEPMEGTAAGELIIDSPGGAGPNSTINGYGGNDLILGDGEGLWLNYLGADNTSIDAALNIDHPSAWSTSTNNPIISFGEPHTSIYIEPGAGQQRYFSVTAGPNEIIRLDVDFTSGTGWGGTDVVVDVLDGSGLVLATSDNSAGDFGSIGSFDSRLSYEPTVGGTYYIRVREFGSTDGNAFEGGEQIFLNVSVSNHAATAPPIVAGDDTISGGAGNDTIFGMLGTDTVYGNGGDDIIVSTGSGSYFGNGGSDTIYANSGSTETLDGGAGIDLLDTTHWSGAYVIDLGTGTTNFAGESFVNFENLRTGVGNDTLTGTSGANIIDGGLGSDVINGLGGADQLFGLHGNDVLDGGAGDDYLSGGGDGFDIVSGGDGNDIVVLPTFSDGGEVHGGAGIDTLYLFLSAGQAAIRLEGTSAIREGTLEFGADKFITDGFENFDGKESNGSLNVIGTDAANTIYTGSGNDTILGAFGADQIFSGAGDDVLSAFGGAFVLDGGDGIDTYNGAVYGLSQAHYWSLGLGYHGSGSFASPVTGTLINIENFIGTDSAEEHVRGTAGVNRLEGGGNNDFLYGLGGGDTLFGQAGNDFLDGGTGNDELRGNGGADVLDGGTGADSMRGGGGNDFYYVDIGGDLVTENADEGIDRVQSRINYLLVDHVENLTLKGPGAVTGIGNALDNAIRGSAGDNTLYGLAGADELYGNDGDDALDGGGGNDRLEGGAGRDTISGANGDDQIVGGTQKDTLFGGDGADTFFFDDGEVGAGASSADIILDFDRAEGDKIHVRQIDANTGAGGDQNFNWIGSGAFTGAARQLHYVHAGGNTFVEGDTDGDGNADFVIRLDGLHNLGAQDFVL